MVSISTEIEIAASTDRVWRVLTDFPSVPSWNPFIREITGEPREGGRLLVRIAPPGKSPMTFKPTVLVADPGRELRWLGRVFLPGVFDGEHWFRLTPLAADRTLFGQGENFSGVLPRFMGRAFLGPTRQGFEAMNRALKRQVEGEPSGTRTG